MAGVISNRLLNNPSLSERLSKLHERWKSDMYILEQTQNRLSVTCNLGLKVDSVVASLEQLIAELRRPEGPPSGAP